jgi:hypothetical protein
MAKQHPCGVGLKLMFRFHIHPLEDKDTRPNAKAGQHQNASVR